MYDQISCNQLEIEVHGPYTLALINLALSTSILHIKLSGPVLGVCGLCNGTGPRALGAPRFLCIQLLLTN